MRAGGVGCHAEGAGYCLRVWQINPALSGGLCEAQSIICLPVHVEEGHKMSLEKGDAVQLFGLDTVVLNGQVGTLLSQKATGRWMVLMDESGKKLGIKPEKLRVILRNPLPPTCSADVLDAFSDDRKYNELKKIITKSGDPSSEPLLWIGYVFPRTKREAGGAGFEFGNRERAALYGLFDDVRYIVAYGLVNKALKSSGVGTLFRNPDDAARVMQFHERYGIADVGLNLLPYRLPRALKSAVWTPKIKIRAENEMMSAELESMILMKGTSVSCDRNSVMIRAKFRHAKQAADVMADIERIARRDNREANVGFTYNDGIASEVRKHALYNEQVLGAQRTEAKIIDEVSAAVQRGERLGDIYAKYCAGGLPLPGGNFEAFLRELKARYIDTGIVNDATFDCLPQIPIFQMVCAASDVSGYEPEHFVVVIPGMGAKGNLAQMIADGLEIAVGRKAVCHEEESNPGSARNIIYDFKGRVYTESVNGDLYDSPLHTAVERRQIDPLYSSLTEDARAYVLQALRFQAWGSESWTREIDGNFAIATDDTDTPSVIIVNAGRAKAILDALTGRAYAAYVDTMYVVQHAVFNEFKLDGGKLNCVVNDPMYSSIQGFENRVAKQQALAYKADNRAFKCEDEYESPAGWCQTWSAFQAECTLLGSDIHDTLLKIATDSGPLDAMYNESVYVSHDKNAAFMSNLLNPRKPKKLDVFLPSGPVSVVELGCCLDVLVRCLAARYCEFTKAAALHLCDPVEFESYVTVRELEDVPAGRPLIITDDGASGGAAARSDTLAAFADLC